MVLSSVATGDAVVVIVSGDIESSREVFGTSDTTIDVVSRDAVSSREVSWTGCKEGMRGSSPVVSAMFVLFVLTGMVLSFASWRFFCLDSRLVFCEDDRVFMEVGPCRWYQPTPWKVFAGLQPSSEVVGLVISQDDEIYHDPHVC